MQVCTSLQTDNQASTPPLSFLQAGCPSCHPTNSVKALKATCIQQKRQKNLCCLLKIDITSVTDANEEEHASRRYTVVFFVLVTKFTMICHYAPIQRPFVRDYPGEPVPER